MFRFHVDGSSGVPPYLQLVHQVRQSLLLGYLQEGDRLPTVKDVASDLVINPNTVVKAYRQLEPRNRQRPAGQARSSPAACRRTRQKRTGHCAHRWRDGSATPIRPASVTRQCRRSSPSPGMT